jgi:hypothetical protein
MEAAGSSETLITAYETMWYYCQQLKLYRRENLKYHGVTFRGSDLVLWCKMFPGYCPLSGVYFMCPRTSLVRRIRLRRQCLSFPVSCLPEDGDIFSLRNSVKIVSASDSWTLFSEQAYITKILPINIYIYIMYLFCLQENEVRMWLCLRGLPCSTDCTEWVFLIVFYLQMEAEQASADGGRRSLWNTVDMFSTTDNGQCSGNNYHC